MIISILSVHPHCHCDLYALNYNKNTSFKLENTYFVHAINPDGSFVKIDKKSGKSFFFPVKKLKRA